MANHEFISAELNRFLQDMGNASCRRTFSLYLLAEYGINLKSFYLRVRQRRIQEWHFRGIVGCVADYLHDDGITTIEQIYAWYDALPDKNMSFTEPTKSVKMSFYKYMRRRGIGRSCIRKHIQERSFTAWEIKGFKAIYDEFRKLQQQG